MTHKKIATLTAFYKLSKKQQKAVMLLFSGNINQKEIAEQVGVHPSTLSHWKEWEEFRDAQDEYNVFMLRDLTSEAIITMRKLLHAKSEMVRFNAAKDILDRSLSGVEDAQQRKLNAEANIAEAKLNGILNSNNEQMTTIDNLLVQLDAQIEGDENHEH